MRKVELVFYKTKPAEVGLKLVIWEILVENETGHTITHDWGFANWNGEDFDPIETPAGTSAVVAMWANTVDPAVLLSDESKIIKL